MIQFNLLPDVKLEYLRTERTKRTVILISSLVGGVAFAIFLLLFTLVNVGQKQHLANLQKDIATDKKTLQEVPNIAKILTIQNQLNTLPGLHNKKPVTSRVLGFVQQLTPSGASISKLDIKWEENSMTIEGTADSLAVVNTMVDTIKFTEATVQASAVDNASPENKEPFTEVVLQTFAVSNSAGVKKPVTYTINFKYDPIIFSNDYVVSLAVNGGRQ